MKRIRTITALIGAAAIGLPLLASGQQQPDIGKEINVGKREYDVNCAVCHGPKGKGPGRLGPADLTTLAQRNGGWFPIARVYEVIDGRRLVKAHGSREMPVWGLGYWAEALEYYAQAPANAEADVRDRILALTEYVYRLQVK